jgi:hypothetical protein
MGGPGGGNAAHASMEHCLMNVSMYVHETLVHCARLEAREA